MLDLIIPIMLAIISAVFFKFDRNQDKKVHVFVSIHGICVALAYLLAMMVYRLEIFDPFWTTIFTVLGLAGFSSVGFAWFRYQGPQIVQALHLVTISGFMLVMFGGGMMITNTWL